MSTQDPIADKLDQLAVLLDYWQREGAWCRNVSSTRSAALLIIDEINDIRNKENIMRTES